MSLELKHNRTIPHKPKVLLVDPVLGGSISPTNFSSLWEENRKRMEWFIEVVRICRERAQQKVYPTLFRCISGNAAMLLVKGTRISERKYLGNWLLK